MKCFLFSLIFVSMSILLIACGDDGLESLSYGNCKMGDRRCSGTKLEMCTDYNEWKLETECADSGGTCIPDDGTPHCNVEVEETTDEIVIWEDEEEVEDDGGSQLLDNFGSVDENDEEQDESTVEIDDENTTDTDIENDSDGSDSDTDSDDDDSDSVDDSDIVPVCGNGILEGDEICEKNGVKDCIEVDPEKYTAGKAICDETCMDYNTVTCVE